MVSRLLCRNGTPWHLDLHPPRLAKTLWADPLGRHRDLFYLERLYRRRGPLWRARCGSDTGRAHLVSAARPRLSSKGEPSLRGKSALLSGVISNEEGDMSALRAYMLGHPAMEQTRYVRLTVPPHMGRYALHIAYQVFGGWWWGLWITPAPTMPTSVRQTCRIAEPSD